MSMMSSQARLSRWIALLGVTMLTLYLSWKVLEPFVGVLLLGVALAAIFRPWHLRFLRLTGKPVLAAGLSTVFTIVVLVVPMAFVSLTLVKEVPGAIRSLQSGVETVQAKWAALADADSWLATVRRDWQLDEAMSPEKLREYGGEISGAVVKNAVNVLGGVLGFFLNSVFLVFVLFFLYRDGGKLGARFVDLVPLPRDQTLQLAGRTEEVLHACVYGVIMVASVQGFLGGVTFWALGLPSPVTWGVVMTLLCTLPIVGAWLVWLPAALGLAIQGDYMRAAILVVVGQFVISSIDGFLRPVLVGQRAKLHELVIFFAVLGGLRYFGLLGILLGPVIMSLAYGLLGVLWKAQQAEGNAGEAV